MDNGYCDCGWPLLSDGTCSDAECPLGWQWVSYDDAEAAEKVQP